LVDKNAREKIVRVAALDPEDVVLEIGPGRGEMTETLAGRSRRVIAVEIDQRLAERLVKTTASLGNVEVIHGDALKVDLESLCRPFGRKLKVVANLPYQISTPLLVRFTRWRHLFVSLILMLQKEVAQRIVAKPGTKDYGVLSVLLQLYTTPTIEMVLPPECFSPRPRVDSALVRLILHEQPREDVRDEEAFRRVVRACFGHRRKRLKNALRSILPEGSGTHEIEGMMISLGIDPGRRAETLNLQEFARLTAGLAPYMISGE
jgi:16S rRNA (adenine1518-N6/adenine1519-N6)-dimethyltransferase